MIFSLLGLYLLGKLRFAYDSETKTIGVPRLLLSIITFAFVVYMLPGMWGAPLRGLSGYLPPIHTQDFVTGSEDASRRIDTFAGSGATAQTQRFPKPAARIARFLRL